uniref:hypothetical protein n=1 Tax=Streptococcus dysgalactiae TaxID=1334 RepID=UPI0006516D2F
EAYRVANKSAKRVVARARAKAMDVAYEELAEKGGEGKLLRIAKARDKASKDITAIKQIKDEAGVVLREEKVIRGRWREYFYKLLNEENPRKKRGEG